jgi:hypothetical protein
MMKAVAVALFALLPLAPAAHASQASDLALAVSAARAQSLKNLNVINWKVGDTENFQIAAASMGNLGTEVETVESDTGTALWVKETMALEGQNQVAEMLLNKADGKILDYKVNGQEQTIPDDTVTITSQDYENVTVPAGTFKSEHIVANEGTTTGIELWVNPDATVMEGSLKQLVPTQYGITLDIELTSVVHGS